MSQRAHELVVNDTVRRQALDQPPVLRKNALLEARNQGYALGKAESEELHHAVTRAEKLLREAEAAETAVAERIPLHGADGAHAPRSERYPCVEAKEALVACLRKNKDDANDAGNALACAAPVKDFSRCIRAAKRDVVRQILEKENESA